MTRGSPTGDLAEVKGYFIGIEDHGILSFNLDFGGDGWGQGTGHYACDGYDKATGKRKPSKHLAWWVRNVLDLFGKTTLDDVVGEPVYLHKDDSDRIIALETTGLRGSKRKRWDFRRELEAMSDE